MNPTKNIDELNKYCEDENKSIVVHKGKLAGFKSNRQERSRNMFGFKS